MFAFAKDLLHTNPSELFLWLLISYYLYDIRLSLLVGYDDLL